MSFEMEMPESMETGGGNFLKEPGTYHLSVGEMDEAPRAGDTLLNGFRASCVVLAGSNAKKTVDLMFFNPKLTDKNNGEHAKKKQARFAMATGIMPEFKPGVKVVVDLQQAKGRQFIATVDFGEKNGQPTKYLELHFADIWHIDDPEAPKCDRNQAAIDLLPKSVRRDPASFKPADANGHAKSNGNGSNGNGNGQGNASKQTVAAGAGADDDPLAGL